MWPARQTFWLLLGPQPFTYSNWLRSLPAAINPLFFPAGSVRRPRWNKFGLFFNLKTRRTCSSSQQHWLPRTTILITTVGFTAGWCESHTRTAPHPASLVRSHWLIWRPRAPFYSRHATSDSINSADQMYTQINIQLVIKVCNRRCHNMSWGCEVIGTCTSQRTVLTALTLPFIAGKSFYVMTIKSQTNLRVFWILSTGCGCKFCQSFLKLLKTPKKIGKSSTIVKLCHLVKFLILKIHQIIQGIVYLDF